MNLSDLQSAISTVIFGRKDYGENLRIKGSKKAFAIYRNNIFVSLINTLQGLYPMTAELCGNDFAEIASSFVESFPPSQAHLLHYGKEFPDFIAASKPELKTVADYERCCNLSYGSGREQVLTAEAFLQYDEDVRLGLDVRLSQSCFILPAIPYILAEALCERSVTGDILMQAQSAVTDSSVLITRHDNGVLSLPISMAEADFLTAVCDGRFASALEAFIESDETAEIRLGQFFGLSVFRLN